MVYRRQNFNNFCIYRLIFGISYSLMTPVIPLFFDSIGMSTMLIGSIISFYGLCEMFTQVPFGIISDIVGDSKSLKIAMVILSIVPLGYIFIKNDFLAGSLYVIQGGIFGMAAPATFSILSRTINPEKRGKDAGLAFSVFTLGGGIGAAIAGFFISKINDYNIVFLLSAIGLFISLIYLVLNVRGNSVKKIKTKKEEKSVEEIFRIITKRKLWIKILIVAALGFLGDYIYGCVISMIHFYGGDVLHASKGYTSALISLYLIVFALGAPVAGIICDKISSRKQLVISFFIINFSLLGLLLTRSIPIFTGIIIMLFIGAILLNAVFQSAISEFGAEEGIGGFIIGIVGAVESLGFALGPLISAYIYGLDKNLLFLSILVVSTGVSIFYMTFIKKARI
ncbi:MAG: MFS transporter [Clostridium sp.]